MDPIWCNRPGPIANFTHEFFKLYAITFDYTDMSVVIT
jgi:hypothetical protein